MNADSVEPAVAKPDAANPDEPVVAAVDLAVDGPGPSIQITASGVTSTGTVASVLAISPQPDGSDLTVNLVDQGGGIWSGSFTAATICDIDVAVFAEDLDGNVSVPGQAAYCDTLFGDGFE